MRQEEHARQGVASADADLTARREFGNVLRAKEHAREAWVFAWLESVLQDVRFAVRALTRNPGLAVVTIITLALGIGANTAIFSVVNGVLLRPLPYAEPDGLVRIIENLTPDTAGTRRSRAVPFDLDELSTFQSLTTTFSHVGVYPRVAVWLRDRTESARLVGNRLSADILPMLGVEPLRGRVFVAADESASATATLILSYRAWQRHFGGRPEAIGEIVFLDDTPHTVIAIMPPAFEFPDPQAEFWVAAKPTPLPPGAFQQFPMMARLRPDATISEATREVTRILDEMRGNPPADMFDTQAGPPPYEIARVQDEIVGPVESALVMLMAAVGFVLLIACTNVANLRLCQSGARVQELLVRRALGASSGRLLRQLLTESVVLAIVGGIAGLAVAAGGVRLFRALATNLERGDLGPAFSLPRLHEVGVNLEVLAFALAASIATGLLFGLTPAFLQTRTRSADLVRQGAGTSRSGRRFSGLLVVAEVAMASTLLVGAGLLLRSYAKLSSVDPGYDLRVLTFQVARGRYPERERAAFAEQLVQRLRALPGVQSAGWAPLLPMVAGPFGMNFASMADPSARYPVRSYPVSVDFFKAMGIRVIAGQGFNKNDRPGQITPVLINETLAKMAFPGRDAVGEIANNGFFRVVGVVEDMRQIGLEQAAGPQIFQDARYRPGLPRPLSYGPYFALRIDGNPERVMTSLRAVVKQIDERGTVENVATMGAIVANSISRPRMYTILLNTFAGVAISLAAIGIYGVVSYSVVRRTKELGIRVALGARRGEVFGLVLRQGLALSGLGLLVGIAGALGLTRYLESLLFGITPLDWPTFVVVALFMGGVATFASYVPARRATKLDPIAALRCE
jgi:predicted permease